MGFSEQKGARVRRKIGSWAISVTAAIGISSAFVLGGCGSEKAAPAVVKAGAASVPLTEKARTAEMREMMGTIAKQPISKKKAREAAVAHQRHQGFLPREYAVEFGPIRNSYGGWDVLIKTMPSGQHFFVMVDKEGLVKNVVVVY